MPGRRSRIEGTNRRALFKYSIMLVLAAASGAAAFTAHDDTIHTVVSTWCTNAGEAEGTRGKIDASLDCAMLSLGFFCCFFFFFSFR